MSKRAKFVLVTWVGQNVSVMKKAKMSTDKALLKDIIQVSASWWIHGLFEARPFVFFDYPGHRRTAVYNSAIEISSFYPNYIFSTIFELFICRVLFFMLYKKLSIFKIFLKIATFFQKKPNFE